ncbi:YolD-like family protein [Cytobacillus firmus]|uniref:YolD-like family protein n=1 Tax=Cytobacillus firmus TaxID=1399 RepID=UPI0021C76BC6|nr:YolD-like family protein [Cytobacillus firmus]MCU1808140.1 YolD-like family protein [Cytobacillus firmus]
MIRDRGKIKWLPAHFMPEHRAMLKRIIIDDLKQKKPHLDEHEFEEIGYIVMESLKYTIPIRVTIWKDGLFEFTTGIVDKVDMHMKYLLLESNGELSRISIQEITAVERI